MLLLLVLASLVFLMLPGYSDLLYVGTYPIFLGVTANEWLWMVLVTFTLQLLLWPWPFSFQKPRLVSTTSRVCKIFVSVNLLWMAAALYQPMQVLWPAYSNSDPTFAWNVVNAVGAKAAWPALWNLAIVVFPVCRTSPLLAQLGLSSREALPFHYWAGHALVVWLLLHTVLLSVVYYVRVADYSFRAWWDVMVPYRDLYTEGVVNFMGWLGFLFFAALWLSSRPAIRERYFNTFYILHFPLALLAVIFSQLHDYNTLFFVQPAFICWVADRFQRRDKEQAMTIKSKSHTSSMGMNDNDTTAEPTTITIRTTPDTPVVALTMSIPASWRSTQSSTLGPNSMVYLQCPSLSGWQSHPFSISDIDTNSRTLTIYVKALGDWTSDFVQSVQHLIMSTKNEEDEDDIENDPPLLSLKLEGPYGGSALNETLKDYNHVLFLAGGIGLVGVSALIQARHKQRQKSTLMWAVKSAGETSLFSDWVTSLHDGGDLQPEGGRRTTQIHIYITASSSAMDTAPMVKTKTFPVVFSNSEASFTPSRKLREWVLLLAATLGTMISVVLGRFLYNNQKINVDEQSVTQCSSLSSSTLCVPCDKEDPKDDSNSTDFPCCTVPVCYYGFRGAPLLLTCFMVPACVYLVSRICIGAWLWWYGGAATRDTGRDYEQLEMPSFHPFPPEGATLDADTSYNSIISEAEAASRESAAAEELATAAGSTTSPLVRHGRVDIAQVLSDFVTSNSDEKVAVVSCGPSSLNRAIAEHCQNLPHSHQMRFFQVN